MEEVEIAVIKEIAEFFVMQDSSVFLQWCGSTLKAAVRQRSVQQYKNAQIHDLERCAVVIEG